MSFNIGDIVIIKQLGLQNLSSNVRGLFEIHKKLPILKIVYYTYKTKYFLGTNEEDWAYDTEIELCKPELKELDISKYKLKKKDRYL